jgi:hypothetical protein
MSNGNCSKCEVKLCPDNAPPSTVERACGYCWQCARSPRRKEYNRKRAQDSYAVFKERRIRITALLGGKCKLCEVAKKGLHLHHVFYHPTESNYKRSSKSFWNRLRRLNEAEEHPERFQLLCEGCHLLWERTIYLASKMGVSKEQLIERMKTL